MGLDTVELVMEIEDTFSVSISEHAALQMRTPGDILDFLIVHAPTSSRPDCLTATIFHRLRAAARTLGHPFRLRPSDPVSKLLPEIDQIEFWGSLQSASSLRLPELRRPSWMVNSGTILTMIGTLAVGIATYTLTSSGVAALFVSVFATLALGAVFNRLTQRYAVLPPIGTHDLRDLTSNALALNFKDLATQFESPNKKDIWLALQQLISIHLGVPAEKVTLDVDFIHELGCD